MDKVANVDVARSFIAAEWLATVITEKYNLDGPVTCKLFSKLLRTQDNDHYLVTAGNDKYVARIYQNGDSLPRQESDYQFELDWLNYLKSKGISISYPIQRSDGAYLGAMTAPEGLRYYALFSFADGEAMSPMDTEQLYICGANMAQIHLTSNNFQSQYARTPTDLTFLLDKPVERIRQFWGEERVDDFGLLETSANELKEKIHSLLGTIPKGDEWGVIGGDFHSANTRFDTHNRLTFFNFDLCSYGWRAYDLAVFLSNTNVVHSSVTLSESFFAGYYSVRKLSEAEHEAISSFIAIRRIWLMGSFAINDGLAGHTFVAPA